MWEGGRAFLTVKLYKAYKGINPGSFFLEISFVYHTLFYDMALFKAS